MSAYQYTEHRHTGNVRNILWEQAVTITGNTESLRITGIQEVLIKPMWTHLVRETATHEIHQYGERVYIVEKSTGKIFRTKHSSKLYWQIKDLK